MEPLRLQGLVLEFVDEVLERSSHERYGIVEKSAIWRLVRTIDWVVCDVKLLHDLDLQNGRVHDWTLRRYWQRNAAQQWSAWLSLQLL